MTATMRKLCFTQNKDEYNIENYKDTVDPEFVVRESPFTVLLNTSTHFRALYYICMVIVLFCFVDTFLYDLMENGKINIGYGVFLAGFDNTASWRGICLWLFDQSAALLFYPALRIYAFIQKSSSPGGIRGSSTIGLMGLVVLQVLIVGVPTWDLSRNRQEWALSGIITFEMIRIAMKIHATAVVCAPRCHDDKTPLPPFKHYVYFLCAPTLVYRDQYARNEKIRWGKVLLHIIEVAAMIFMGCIVWEKFISPYWSKYGIKSTVEVSTLVHGMFACALPGVIILSCGYYCVLHAWFNAFAEILTFGDRLFYEDWWTSTCFTGFFRTWNRVVYIWLRDYIYKPLTPHAGRMTSTIVVLLVSAIAHEVVIGFTFKFFYPVLLVQMGIVIVLLMPLTTTISHRFPRMVNMLIWIGIFIGNGLLWSLLPMEHFARVNCPPSEYDSVFIPKSWSCPEIMFKANWTFHNPLQNVFN